MKTNIGDTESESDKSDHKRVQIVKGSKYFRDYLARSEIFPTGISQFDELFKTKGICSGEITEIIGLASTGKTMLLNTIIINVLEKSDGSLNILCIDTKNDFQPIKLVNMMTARDIPQAQQMEILDRILVEKVNTSDDLVKVLEHVLSNPHRIFGKVKIIMIDSITVLYYLYMGHTLYNLNFITRIMDLLRRLTKELNIAVLITNLANYVSESYFTSTQSDKSGDNDSEETASSAKSTESLKTVCRGVQPAIGKLWRTVSDHKVLIDFNDYPHQFDKDLERIDRHISLYSSTTLAAPTESKDIQVTNQGII